MKSSNDQSPLQVEEEYLRIWEGLAAKFPEEKIIPSGTGCFKVSFGGYEFTVIKNEMMQDEYALVSPNFYEKLYRYFESLKTQTHE